MPFTPKFAAQFQRRILDNVQAVLVRDVNTALAAIDATLAAVVDFVTPVPIALNFPALYLEPNSSAMKQSDDDSYIEEAHQLLISLSIVGATPDVLKSAIVKYVQAIDQVLRSMSVPDLIGSQPTSAVRKPAWEVLGHNFSAIRANADNTIYRRDAQVVFVVEILER